MSDLPAPLTPPECDLRGMEWMPLHGHKLYGSDFDAIATDAEYRAANRLWWAAWQQQVPAASLPDDDRVLAHIAGYSRDPKGWAKIKEVSMHAFVKCSDGRLYHRFLAPEAIVAWDRRVKERDRKAAYRAKRDGNKGGKDMGVPDPVPRDKPRDGGGKSAFSPDDVPMPSHVDRTTQDRTGQFKKEITPLPPKPVWDGAAEFALDPEDEPPPKPPGRRGVCSTPPGSDADFERFWSAYPRKVGKGQARKAWISAIRTAEPEQIIEAVRLQQFDPRERFQPHPATWLNGERWLDQQQSGDPVLRAAGLLDDPDPDLQWGRLQ